jgi:hypothetical protein
MEAPATVPFWIGCRRFRLLVERGVQFDQTVCTLLAHRAHECDTDDLIVALLSVLSEHGEWLGDFSGPFLGPLLNIWLECELLVGDDADAAECASIVE